MGEKSLDDLLKAVIHAGTMIDHFIHGEENVDSLHLAHDRLSTAIRAFDEAKAKEGTP